jgi:hypothetical protein
MKSFRKLKFMKEKWFTLRNRNFGCDIDLLSHYVGDGWRLGEQVVGGL